MAMIHLTGVELRRQLKQAWSYRLDAVGDWFMWLVAFPVMMWVFDAVAGGYTLEDQARSLIGFLFWDLCFGLIAETTREVLGESRQGTLEQTLLTATPPLKLFGARLLAETIVRVVRTGMLGILLASVLGVSFQVNAVFWVVLLFTVVMSWGVSLVLGGLALVYKEIGSFIGILSLLAVLATGALVPLNALGWIYAWIKVLVPTAWGIEAARSAVLTAASWQTLWSDFTWLGLGVQAGVFLLLGVWSFRWGIRRAQEEGTLGVY